MSERADQIVLEYLRRVADAAYGVLRSDERLEFVARLRRRIDEVRIRQKAHKPAQVKRIIDRLGPPEALVEEERLRLAAERPEDPPRPRNTPPPATPARADTKNPTVVTERKPEPEHPFNQTQPIPVVDDDSALERDTVATPYPAGPADEMEEVREESVEVGAAAEPVPDEDAPPEPEGPEPEGRVPVAAGSRTAARYTRRAVPSDVLAITGRGVPGLPGERRRADFLDVAARHKMASVTVVLLGFGALALPVPLWLVGVVLLVLCQTWPLGDKMLGAAVPIVTAAVYGLATNQAASVLAMSAYTSAGAGGPRLAFGIGGLLGAAYLGFRLSRTTR